MLTRAFLAAIILAAILPAPARAAETQPGDSCAGQTDLIRTVGGPENPGTGYFLVCDGTVWKAVNTWDSASGKSLFQVNTDAGSCTATKLGRLRYDGTSTWEYCNGTSWTALPGSAAAAGSTGYVQFKSSTGGLGGDSGLFWDSTNKRLAVTNTGTAPPAVLFVENLLGGGTTTGIIANVSGSTATIGTNYFAVEHANSPPGYSGTINSVASGDDTRGAFHAAVYNIGNSKNMYSLIGLRRNNSNWSITPTALSNGSYLPGIGFAGQTNTTAGNGMILGASILGVVDNTVSSGNLPSALVFHTSATNAAGLAERMRISSAGNVGIGTASPATTLDVVGNIQFTGTIADVSDRRLKADIVPLPPQLARIERLAPVSFTMKDDPTRRTELGLIAQDVEAVYPALVSTNPNGAKAMNYQGLIAPMIAAMQEQQREIETLRAENAALARRLDAIEEAAAFAPVLRRLPPPIYNQ